MPFCTYLSGLSYFEQEAKAFEDMGMPWPVSVYTNEVLVFFEVVLDFVFVSQVSCVELVDQPSKPVDELDIEIVLIVDACLD